MVSSMNQEKIGKLIATLRKEKGLTQGELGAKVGVGDRAVSKWERGITCPDISIINELSNVLGITADELLSGQLHDREENNTTNTKLKFNKKALLLIPLIILSIGIAIFIINHNKGEVYYLKSINSNYSVEGQALFKNNKMYVTINEIVFKDKKTAEIMIQSYEYNVRSNNEFLYRYGFVDEHNMLDSIMTIEEFSNLTKISFESELNILPKEIIDSGLTIRFSFRDINENVFDQEIKISLNLTK